MPIYKSIYSGPPNSYGANRTAKDYIVIHNTSNDAPAKNEASYARNRTDSVSSHYYVDDEQIIQSLNTDLRAFHVGSARGNSAGIAYEITGTNSKSEAWWRANVAWGLLAKQIRIDCAEHGITAQTLTVDEIKAGKKSGIITHDQARKAWGGTTHTDPGPGFPMSHLIALVKGEDAPAKPSKPSTPKPTVPNDNEEYDMPTLKRGTKGQYVRIMQGLLCAWGYKVTIDGVFGSQTGKQLRAFQAKHAKPADEIAGPVTWRKLLNQ